MRRREFLWLIGSSAATWPLVVRAQKQAVPVIGFLESSSAEDSGHLVAAFRQGLKEAGLIDGENIEIEYRWGHGHNDRLPKLAADLVSRRVSVIVTVGTPPTLAAKAATTTIPIVFAIGIDPVEYGLVASLNRPGTNMTGVVVLAVEVAAKRLQLLHELMPTTTVVALLTNPANPATEPEVNNTRDAARSLGIELHVLRASAVSEIDAAFAKLAELGVGALFVSADPFFYARAGHLVALADRYAVPTIYAWRELVVAGGLVSYGADLVDAYRQPGDYVARILKGASPSDLPVGEATKVRLVINLKTANALGLTIPPSLLARADEVIE